MLNRLLIIDDNQDILVVLRQMLNDAFQVATVPSAQEGLQRFVEGETFDVVLCDLTMPGMTGMEWYEKIKAEFPEMEKRILFMTGGPRSSEAAEFMKVMGKRVVEKPFEPRTLRALLTQIAKMD